MLTAISRYGLRVLPNEPEIIERCRREDRFRQGPDVARFEHAFAERLEVPFAIATSYGRMAFFHLLEAFDLPPGSEIVVPALTFWVIPELARVAGLRVVFADVDPDTFTLRPEALERAITPRTRVVVPTHLYGRMCDMAAIMEIAQRHELLVVEDCAHALGATFDGRQAGTIGDAALFSFHTIKPLNAYGGGMAVARDPEVAARVRARVAALPAPSEERIDGMFRMGRVQKMFTRPGVFTLSAFPVLWGASWFGANPDVYLWESIRSLNPIPERYLERFSNVQAAIALEALERVDGWNDATIRHAHRVSELLAGVPGVRTPGERGNSRHIYYQYCVYVPDRDSTVRRAIRRGVDLETLHVDQCSTLPLFAAESVHTPGAQRATEAVQVPIHAALTDEQIDRIGRTVRRVVERDGGRHAPAQVRV